jgi:hypothetical protein
MNCTFCNKLCNKISDIWHQCRACNTDFHPHATIIYTYINNNNYSVKIHKSGSIKLTISSAYKDPIITLNHGGENITPQNVKEKLKLYLTFL